MKKIAYIITRNGSSELIENGILKTIADGAHGADVIAIYFVEDGVYYLAKSNKLSGDISEVVYNQNVKVFASKQSVRDRKLLPMLLEGVEISTFDSFYEIAKNADHIISI
ncbi:DsrE family protein [candidate division KSB1 bacterium]|nr:DsrE family protein [candidate division KSB1 bacterium]